MSQTDQPTLSRTWADLLYEIHHPPAGQSSVDSAGFHCDVLIVGSGYGGSVAAAALGETLDAKGGPLRVWLLERGQAYVPGEFPSQMADLAGHVRFNTPHDPGTRGRRDGLFDIRVGEDLGVVLANGLGGGSLINAGVMLWPQEEVFQQSPWPMAIQQSLPALQALSRRMQVRLGAATSLDQDNTIQRQDQGLSKFDALGRISQGGDQRGHRADFKPTPITVAMRDGDLSSDGIELKACIRCGDCATGCNHGAKISLDTNLLSYAARRGVRLFTGATVLHIAPVNPVMPNDDGWLLTVNHTDQQRQWREGLSFTLRARRVILAAGSLGSTGILQRSASSTFPLSGKLGQGFSGNGDLLMAAYKQEHVARAIADEMTDPASRDVGPTITAMIDQRRPASSKAELHRGYVIQDLAIPGPLQRVFEEITLTSHAIRQMTHLDGADHHADDPGTDPLCVQPAFMRRTLPLAMIGHDRAEGRISLVEPAPGTSVPVDGSGGAPVLASDGAVTVSWPELRADPRFDRQIDELASLCQASGAGGSILPNPIWQPLPSKLSRQRGPLLIAHPLGGCGMGDTSQTGVVDHIGRVFIPGSGAGKQDDTYNGLAVLDGAMIPSSLGINPSLTIATLSERAMAQLLPAWQLGARRTDQGDIRARAMLPAPPLPSSESTWIEITEQMRGWVGDYGIEITLRLEETPVSTLLRGNPFKRQLVVNKEASFLRVIRKPARIAYDSWDEPQAQVVLKARLSGHLFALHRERSTITQRFGRSAAAWVANRGIRQVTQVAIRFLTGQTLPDDEDIDLFAAAAGLGVSIAHGGEVRLIDYDLVIEEVTQASDIWAPAPDLIGQHIQGSKRLTYSCQSNPWQQLTVMALVAFPRLDVARLRHKTLSLNMAYLAELRIPLLRVTRQRDLPTTLLDLSCLVALFARMLVRIHLLSLHAPDKPLFACQPEAPPKLRPGRLPGLPQPIVTRLVTGPTGADRVTPEVLLTRYPARQAGARQHPLVMLHGYSASGTTFAHPALDPGLAATMWQDGHDVWVVDLRTSPGLTKTATLPWTFEDVALSDIPIALAHIADQGPSGQVNVFAHCMGSAMLWMALLTPDQPARPRHGPAREALNRLQKPQGLPLIHRLGMSQIAPIIHFSEGNLLRAFVLRYVRQYLPLGPYRFKPSPEDTLTHKGINDLLDQLLATIPYPQAEWRKENPLIPPWRTTPWAGTRRRMDLLYGRTFNLPMVSRKVLHHIDDFFGPMNLNTLSQVLHMARNKRLTNPSGHSIYLSQRRLTQAMDNLDAMMSVHGEQNGLSDIKGMYAFKAYVQTLGPAHDAKYTVHPIANLGHQDCLIGTRAAQDVFGHIKTFFQ